MELLAGEERQLYFISKRGIYKKKKKKEWKNKSACGEVQVGGWVVVQETRICKLKCNVMSKSIIETCVKG